MTLRGNFRIPRTDSLAGLHMNNRPISAFSEEFKYSLCVPSLLVHCFAVHFNIERGMNGLKEPSCPLKRGQLINERKR